MKNIGFLLLLILFSGCCAFHSGDCFCNPPDPELSAEALDWIMPFENIPFFVFEDNNGNLDTLLIERQQDTEWVGGDECGTEGDVERAIITSKSTGEKLISIAATMIDFVYFNHYDDGKTYIFTQLNAQTDDVYAYNENATASINNDFEWNGATIAVVAVICENSPGCNDLKIRSFTISKELGLLRFTDGNNQIWMKIN